jgi:hypothetical protein
VSTTPPKVANIVCEKTSVEEVDGLIVTLTLSDAVYPIA